MNWKTERSKGKFGRSEQLKGCIHRFQANGFVYGKCIKCGAKNKSYPEIFPTPNKRKYKIKSLVRLFEGRRT